MAYADIKQCLAITLQLPYFSRKLGSFCIRYRQLLQQIVRLHTPPVELLTSSAFNPVVIQNELFAVRAVFTHS
jgi:hypothetical protein